MGVEAGRRAGTDESPTHCPHDSNNTGAVTDHTHTNADSNSHADPNAYADTDTDSTPTPTPTPAGYRTETFAAVPAATGTRVWNGGQYAGLMAGDDAGNESFRAFWTFDLGKVKSSHIQKATLSFTHKRTAGDPFSLGNLGLGLGGIRVWIVRYDATGLPRFGVVTITEVQELYVPELAGEPLRASPAEYDITTYVERIGQNMAADNLVQLMVGFQKTSNNDGKADFVEWEKAAITVTYAPV